MKTNKEKKVFYLPKIRNRVEIEIITTEFKAKGNPGYILNRYIRLISPLFLEELFEFVNIAIYDQIEVMLHKASKSLPAGNCVKLDVYATDGEFYIFSDKKGILTFIEYGANKKYTLYGSEELILNRLKENYASFSFKGMSKVYKELYSKTHFSELIFHLEVFQDYRP